MHGLLEMSCADQFFQLFFRMGFHVQKLIHIQFLFAGLPAVSGPENICVIVRDCRIGRDLKQKLPFV